MIDLDTIVSYYIHAKVGVVVKRKKERFDECCEYVNVTVNRGGRERKVKVKEKI